MKFSRIAVLRKHLQLDSKSDHEWNDVALFWLEYAPFCQPNIFMDRNLQELLQCDCLLTSSNVFDCKFEEYSGLFFKDTCTF